MAQTNAMTDFRATRRKLPPEAFLLGPERPDPSPQDLVEAQVWNSMVSLPDDVCLRTSDNQGSHLKAMHELWASWIESVGEDQDCMYYVMADAGDECQACLFNALCGFYRVAASCLRSALELTVVGTYFQLRLGLAELLEWKEGRREAKFGTACDCLIRHSGTAALEGHLKSKIGLSVFGQRSLTSPAGWAPDLYDRLSRFAHSRPSYSAGAMWEGSNGPVYIRESFEKVRRLYLETMALGYALVKLARPAFPAPRTAKLLFPVSKVQPSSVGVLSYEFLWGQSLESWEE